MNADDDDQQSHFPRFPQTPAQRSRPPTAKQSSRSRSLVRHHQPFFRIPFNTLITLRRLERAHPRNYTFKITYGERWQQEWGGGRTLVVDNIPRWCVSDTRLKASDMLKPPLVEGGVCALLMSSIFQSAFALTYPRDPFPPMPTPVKPFSIPANSPAVSQQTKPKILSPAVCPLGFELTSRTHVALYKVTPQKQRPFNPTSSTLSTSTYLTSPVSTPSRTLNYGFPATSPFNDSTNSNMSMSTSVPPSPSPMLSSPLMAYRGKHSQSSGSEWISSTLTEQITDIRRVVRTSNELVSWETYG